MHPTDYRNDTWDAVQLRVNHKRRAVLAGLRAFGPCTTRQLADRMKADILAVRPRVTELVQLGFVALATDTKAGGHEGVYRAFSDDEALAQFHARQAEERTSEAAQPELKLPAAA
jgi:predicted ArsR family transcriptional regulator